MVNRGAPSKRKAVSKTNAATASKKSKGAMFGKSKKKGSSSGSGVKNSVQEMFQSIAEDPADPNSVINLEGAQAKCISTKRKDFLTRN